MFNNQILAGLAVWGISLSTSLFRYRNPLEVIGISRELQGFATFLLILGTRYVHPMHRPKMLLYWLGITSFFCTMLIYLTLDYIEEFGFNKNAFEDNFATILPLLAAAIVTYMMNIVYAKYVELTQGPVKHVKNDQPPLFDPKLHNSDISPKA